MDGRGIKRLFRDRQGVTHTVRMRPVNETDDSFLYDVVSSTVRNQFKKMGGDIQIMEPLLRIQYENQTREYRKRFPQASHLIVTINNVDAGRIYLDRNSEEIRILDVTLLPEYRGKGLGAFILKMLEEEAAQNQLPIRIYVEEGNPSLRLFRRLGYQFQGKYGEVHNLLQWTPPL